MGLKQFKVALSALSLFLLLGGTVSAAPTVSKTSERAVRYAANPAITVVPGFTAVAVSSTMIQWSWSTGSFTGSGLTGYKLYTSSAAGAYIDLALNTSYYIDTGLGANKAYTRWVTVHDGTDQGSDTEHLQKYTYAVPPAEVAISSDAPPVAPDTSIATPWARITDTVISTGAYVEIPQAYWFPNPVYASGYVVECSTNGGTTYVRNRAFFVPWNSFPVLSNREYMIRVGALNGDNELTPGVYSATRTFTTPPLTPDFTAVAISSYSIQWQWNADDYSGTGITSFKLYRSTITDETAIPEPEDAGELLATLGSGTSYWTEVYVDSGTVYSADSIHTRWLKVSGFLESENSYLQKHTYAIAPGSATAVWIEHAPFWTIHVGKDNVSLNWQTPDSSTDTFGDTWRPGIATEYVIDYSTTAGFTVGVTSAIVGAPPQSITGLTDNTKYDMRVGAINGDGEQTPDNALNPYAYSQLYRVMTRPDPPSDFACIPRTDTAMHCTWSTSTYVNVEYIAGYSVGKLRTCIAEDGTELDCWDPLDTLAGVESNEYNLDYLETNSTHTISLWANQQDPDWVAGNTHYDAGEWEYYYNNYGSCRLDYAGYTFATPPNDVAFDTITARSVNLWWKEPEVPATAYRVERATSTGEFGPWVFVSSATGTSYLDTDLTPLTTYAYRIGAVNLLGFQTIGISTATDGHRRDYSYVSSTITKHTSPTMYGVAYGTDSISWSWSDSTAGVLSYNIYDSTYGLLTSGLASSATFWLEVSLSSSNAVYTRNIASLRADTGIGEFAVSTAATLAEAPSTLAASSTDVHFITIGWTGDKGTRYKVDRSSDAGATWTGIKTWTDEVSTQTLADTGLTPATTYYYAVSSYNLDGIVSVSSAVSAAIRTLDLPSMVTPVYSTATAVQTVNATLPGLGTLSVSFPAGSLPADGYISVSTNAATAPEEISKANLDAATAKLDANSLLSGGIVELRRYDMSGALATGSFPTPASVVFTYLDANDDGIVDGTTTDENTLRVFTLDTSALTWNPDRNSVLDRVLKTVSLATTHFSFYALGSVVSVVGGISDSFAYPNPYKPGSAGQFGQSALGDGIVFESMPAGSRVKIFSLAGSLVRELTDDDSDGRCFWDTRNDDGSSAASGLYIYLVTAPDGGKKTGRVAIIR